MHSGAAPTASSIPLLNYDRNKPMHSPILVMIAASLLLASGCSRKPGADSNAENEKKLEEMMSGVTLVGHSSRANKEGVGGEERYVIDKVSRLAGDTWVLQTRIKYGSHDLSVPIPVTIKWAGDTPVITLTDLKIPGLGEYTARVLLYRGQYAGTWSAKDHGGEVFGKIVRTP